ncbi:MAG TPA: pyridoxal-phosphate dependent enzyme, partial [Tissierellaceae bacterium]|nr:pyridoxal-phosphate dependent enzyme [Tissierellaceae bacterium]
KSLAYEIWEQLGYICPDNIICPVGNGSIALGLVQGFKELLNNSEVDKLPRIFGVEPANSNAIYRKFNGLKEDFEAEPTIAEGIALRYSSKAQEVVKAISESKGEMEAVTEGEIIKALEKISKKGFFIEPTSAAALAGLTRLIDKGEIAQDEKTVVIISGNGLKASDKILQYLVK